MGWPGDGPARGGVGVSGTDSPVGIYVSVTVHFWL